MSGKQKVFCCLLLVLFSAVLCGKPLVLEIWYDEFPPYFLKPDDPRNPGFAVELIRKVLPPDQFTLVWNKGWSTAVTGLEQGQSNKYQVIAAMHPADTGKAVCSSLPLFTVESALFVLKTRNVRIASDGILPDGKGSMPRNWSVSDEADPVIEKRIKARTMLLWQLSQAAAKSCDFLFRKKILFFINDPVSVEWTLVGMKRKPEELKRLSLPCRKVTFYTAFAKDSGSARKAGKVFEKNCSAFLQTKEYTALRKKYCLPEK